jgi:hypothetical protein
MSHYSATRSSLQALQAPYRPPVRLHGVVLSVLSMDWHFSYRTNGPYRQKTPSPVNYAARDILFGVRRQMPHLPQRANICVRSRFFRCPYVFACKACKSCK